MGFFIVLSILLLLLDYHHYLPSLRRVLNNAAAPLQYVIDAPLRFLNKVDQSVTTQSVLRTDNIKLQSQQLFLEAKLQRFDALESENRQLNQLLSASEHLKKQRIELARLLLVNADPLLNEVLLDKGQNDGVYIGQPVIDADGIMGQVISVDLLTSRVLLLTDFRSAIPVQDVRSDARGILVGRGRLAKLTLRDTPGTVDIKVNDLLVTSGLGGHYPPGYPVGLVSSVNMNVAAQFASIQVTPSAQLNRNRPVLLIWPDKSSGTATKVVSPHSKK
ncbi:cell shape-determining protein MreC [Candidatus Rickettsiella viridis]|uniref:Cell shape-determining protein MreC n=1 Tax=Candidatus Rickettsiella viridis TaxID=676208 RepID=A0A2Z5UU81_9COXI|nr:cell shape-determining protein MreC [Candidatus Rickettsiella viridis]